MRRAMIAPTVALSILLVTATVPVAAARPSAHRSARAACGARFADKAKRSITAGKRGGGRQKLGEAYIFLRTKKPTEDDPYTTYQFCWVIDLNAAGRHVNPVLQSAEYGKDRSSPLEDGSSPIGGPRTVAGTSERADARSVTLRVEWFTARGPVRAGHVVLSAHV